MIKQFSIVLILLSSFMTNAMDFEPMDPNQSYESKMQELYSMLNFDPQLDELESQPNAQLSPQFDSHLQGVPDHQLQPLAANGIQEIDQQEGEGQPLSKNEGDLCSLCNVKYKNIYHHLYRIHKICNCGQSYNSVAMVLACRKTHRYQRANPEVKKLFIPSDVRAKCDLCNKTLSTQGNVSLHKLMVHFICRVCKTQRSSRAQAIECAKRDRAI
jgi:hypothetical protein